ncbi:MAG: hypothetical protein ACI9MC_003974 [Kiritimatiellia bacterium]|jgi:hypothetical protein
MTACLVDKEIIFLVALTLPVIGHASPLAPDGVPNYVDLASDGDKVLTRDERADRNHDGDPSDAADVNENGIATYLDSMEHDPDGDEVPDGLESLWRTDPRTVTRTALSTARSGAGTVETAGGLPAASTYGQGRSCRHLGVPPARQCLALRGS